MIVNDPDQRSKESRFFLWPVLYVSINAVRLPEFPYVQVRDTELIKHGFPRPVEASPRFKIREITGNR